MEELFLELASAKKIIQLLQEEQSVYRDPTAEETTEEGHNPRVSNELNNHWMTNTNKSRKIKQVNSYRNVQQIKTHNRFQVIEQFRDYSDSGDRQKSKKSRNVPNAIMKKTVNKCHKIILIGDSHARDCAQKLSNYLGTS